MSNKEFYDLMRDIFAKAEEIARKKGEDYTRGDADALLNFKEAAGYFKVTPQQVCGIFMNKHYQAICNYIKTGGESESEPISERIKDMINYLVLFQALVIEEKIKSTPSKYEIRG